MKAMNSFSSTLTAMLVTFSGLLFSQSTTLCIPYSTPAVIDGVISSGEWTGADSVQIMINNFKKVTVLIKHDSTALYFAYLNHLESSMRFPEILLDINNDKSNTWQNDDWWFHVSATDCESNGMPANYSNCLVVQQNWEAVPNMVSGLPNTDTIEIKIPFFKAGIDLTVHDTIGIAFDVTNTVNAWNYWPAGANINTPSTWAQAVFCLAVTGLSPATERKETILFPNPSSGYFKLQSSVSAREITLMGTDGYEYKTNRLSGDEFDLSIENIPNGLYIYKILHENFSISTGKIILSKQQ